MTFERDVEPILTRAGCNAGACHGKARGQNGFALSLLGFDPDFDYEAIAKEARRPAGLPAGARARACCCARRRRGCRTAAAGGSSRGSPAYETVLRWIAAGMPRTPADAPALERIAVEPTERTLKPARVVPARASRPISPTARPRT